MYQARKRLFGGTESCVQYGNYDQAFTRALNLVVGVADDDLPALKYLRRVHDMIDSTNE